MRPNCNIYPHCQRRSRHGPSSWQRSIPIHIQASTAFQSQEFNQNSKFHYFTGFIKLTQTRRAAVQAPRSAVPLYSSAYPLPQYMSRDMSYMGYTGHVQPVSQPPSYLNSGGVPFDLQKSAPQLQAPLQQPVAQQQLPVHQSRREPSGSRHMSRWVRSTTSSVVERGVVHDAAASPGCSGNDTAQSVKSKPQRRKPETDNEQRTEPQQPTCHRNKHFSVSRPGAARGAAVPDMDPGAEHRPAPWREKSKETADSYV
jgi:hypothetical protein